MTAEKGDSTLGAAIGAEFLMKLVNYRWFAGRFPASDVDELALARLLIGAYQANARGVPIHKKAAAGIMRVEDARTARKYVAFAETRGLLSTVTSAQDRRKEILLPTPALGTLIREEADNICRELGLDESVAKKVGMDMMIAIASSAK